MSIVDSIVDTRYWHALPDGRVQCDVCPRACKLHEGQRGLCFVRGAEEGRIKLFSYGRSSGFCVDPIEKKPLNHFLPGTSVLSFGTAGCNLACKFCFPPETLVATRDGMRPIAELFAGCEEKISREDGRIGIPTSLTVWTRGARPARVAKVFAHPYSGELIRLKAACCPALSLTPNHRVFATHRSDLTDVRLVQAGSLTLEHYLLVPKRQAGSGARINTAELLGTLDYNTHAPRLRRVPLDELSVALQSNGTSAVVGTAFGYHPAYVRTLRISGIPDYLDLTCDLAWVLGLYCAEGSICAHPQRPNSRQLVFSFGHHEGDLVKRAARVLLQQFGVRPVIVTRRTTVTVEIRSTSVSRLFEALCGRGAKNKRVPGQLLGAPLDVIRAFLDGYLDGDGYRAPKHVVAGTVSRQLALGLYELGLHCNLPPTFFGSERTVWRDAGDYFLVPLRNIERFPYRGEVYNLEVDDPDHSYLAPFLAVSNCQNWDMSKSREMDKLADRASPEDLAGEALRLGCASVAFTYNDPVVFMEYAIDAAEACRERGIRSVAVTAGYMCAEPRIELYQHMDAANVDLKGFTERFYYKVCGGALAPVLETLEYLKNETRVWFEITTLLIPGENDSDEELDRLTQWVAEKLGPDVPLHFTAFHPDWKMLDRPATPPATLARARGIALNNGLHYVYTGNVHDSKGGSTYCPKCGTRVIERDWYQLGAWGLDGEGACNKCGTRIPGVFAGKPGAWGRRRMGVRLARLR